MPPQLVALTDGPSLLLDKPILLLGRHQECDIQLVSRKVSRRHCCIAQVGDHLVVRDLGSTNGIRVNGVRVLEGNLRPGDELTIGNYRYQVRWDALGGGAPARPNRSTALRNEPSPIPRPARVADDDELLEACEEPVPLAEPAPRPRLPQTGLVPGPEAPGKSVSPPREPPPPVLPEVIELAPASDVFPSPPKPPPPP
jgi:predicted component of type VI protein secretion system